MSDEHSHPPTSIEGSAASRVSDQQAKDYWRRRNRNKLFLGIAVALLAGVGLYAWQTWLTWNLPDGVDGRTIDVAKGLPHEAVTFLEEADSIELISIGLLTDDSGKQVRAPLGSLMLEGRQRRAALDAFYAAIEPQGRESKCFWPRHTLVARKGEQAQRYVVSFQCREARVSGDVHSGVVKLDNAPEAWNAILRAADVELEER